VFGVLRPLNRAVKFRLPSQSGDSTALRLAASSKLRRTAYELLDSVQVSQKAAKLLRESKPNRKASEISHPAPLCNGR